MGASLPRMDPLAPELGALQPAGARVHREARRRRRRGTLGAGAPRLAAISGGHDEGKSGSGSCLRALLISTRLLQRCAAAGLTLAEFRVLCSRPPIGIEEEECSQLQRACGGERASQKKAPFLSFFPVSLSTLDPFDSRLSLSVIFLSLPLFVARWGARWTLSGGRRRRKQRRERTKPS